jgi:CDP-diglyceride synthetase
MLHLKGVITGAILFGIAAMIYVVLRMKQLAATTPHPAGAQVGIDVRTISAWTLRDPMFWIMFIACITLCSFMFQALKKG